jgi:hypothetical protein
MERWTRVPLDARLLSPAAAATPLLFSPPRRAPPAPLTLSILASAALKVTCA